MNSGPVTTTFNDAYIAELFEAYRRDPASVDDSWRQFFDVAQRFADSGAPAASGGGPADPVLLKKAAGAAALMQATRSYGHFAVQLDPLGTPPLGAPELTPEFHGITEGDLDLVPGSALGFPHMATAADVIRRLRFRYSTTLGIEVTHLAAEEERKWFRQLLTAEALTRPLTPDEKQAVLVRLTEVDGLERFIGRAYPNAKRFSIEGTDALVPMLDATITEGAAAGARTVAIAMAHRGRLNVLAHILGKPYASIFDEFEGKHEDSGTGDVKYHLGAQGTRTLPGGETIGIVLVPNPSHLEMVNPVLEGMARALQRDGTALRHERVIPVCVHGDAAFPGEGVVSETFNLSRLAGYSVGGTLHIIVNNQIGFTTDPAEARSTHYASDIAKGFDVPIIHVNADNAEACIIAVRIGVAYRTRFHKDFLIDLVGYRRHGHNEGDEPGFTQPLESQAIKAHPTARVVWGERLVREGVVAAAVVANAEREIMDRLTAVHEAATTGAAKAPAYDPPHPPVKLPTRPMETAVPAERLIALNERLLTWPAGLTMHSRLARTLARRREALGPKGSIDWGLAETLAFASVLTEGTPVRLSGQDAERGTFSHRHAVLHDANTGARYIPLQHLEGGAPFEIYNSPLSETAVLGFEYGFSAAVPEALVLWEAQYGDFVNVAQPIIDQFLTADRTKWGQDSDVVLLLPHGYEGGGPGALERAARAVPADVRRGEHGGRVSHDRGAVLPHPAAACEDAVATAVGVDDTQEPPAAGPRGIAAGGSRDGAFPGRPRRSRGVRCRSARAGDASRVLHGQDLLRSQRGRRPVACGAGPHGAAVSVAARGRSVGARSLPRGRRSGVGSGRAQEHGGVDVRGAAPARGGGQRDSGDLHRPSRTGESRGRVSGVPPARAVAARRRGAGPPAGRTSAAGRGRDGTGAQASAPPATRAGERAGECTGRAPATGSKSA